jgi:hypothetical protein
MAVRANAYFHEGISRIRFRALNDDLTRIKGGYDTNDEYDGLQADGAYDALTGNGRIVGGTGPFDLSGYATPAAIPLTFKFDNDVAASVNVDFTAGVVDLTAVTAAEVIARINVAAPADMLASVEAGTGRVLIVYNGTDDPEYIQTYGDLAKLIMIGQGLGQQLILSDTIKSLAETPTKKDDETISEEPANGASIDIIIDGYKKGATLKIVDVQTDFYLKQLVENGYIDSNGAYHDPHSGTPKIYFEIEVFNPVYDEGPNKQNEVSAWERTVYLTCSGSVGERTKEKAIQLMNYDITCTNYEDALGVKTGAIIRERLSVADFNALDIDNV